MENADNMIEIGDAINKALQPVMVDLENKFGWDQANRHATSTFLLMASQFLGNRCAYSGKSYYENKKIIEKLASVLVEDSMHVYQEIVLEGPAGVRT